MKRMGRLFLQGTVCALAGAFSGTAVGAEPEKSDVPARAQAVLKSYCYRCHGQDGSLEGGMSYILDRDKLVARKKVVPGKADESPIYKRAAAGKMPPPGQNPRPNDEEIRLLKKWIDEGAANPIIVAERKRISEADVFNLILADLETLEPRSRRFTRYFTLSHLYNAGLGEDELQTYRNAVSKLANSLSWSPRIWVPKAIDPAKTILRIDLRDFQWDANLWNRLLAEYPYGILEDTATAKVAMVTTATRMPFVRGDWFVATASRPPLYQDMLQLPTTIAEVERQLRVDAAVDIQQERVARAGFNGSGVAKNNRMLERHEAVHGAYWRTYDFEAVPPNLIDRDNLLPDRRNLFAHPLGPGFTQESFQHIGGEAIWNLPNGLHAYMLVNANGQRIDKANTAIVSDPKRPDKAVETGVSCFTCHYAGINYKDDQIREYVQKSPKAFNKSDRDLVLSLYPAHEKMKSLMDEDAERYRKAVEKTGTRVSIYEPISTLTLRYEGDVDVTLAVAEAGLTPEAFKERLGKSELLSRNLGALQSDGGTVQREVWQQGFGDVVREMELGLLLRTTLSGQTLPDNTGEIDPLEAQSSPANCVAFSPDGKFALISGADRSIRVMNVETSRDLRRLIGHTASVWSLAFSLDGKFALSGSADGTVRLWNVESGKELRKLEGNHGLVSCVAFSADGSKAISGAYDGTCVVWDLDAGKELRTLQGEMKYIHAAAFLGDGHKALVAADKSLWLWDIDDGKNVGKLDGHTDSVITVVPATDGKTAFTGGDDGIIRLWDIAGMHQVRSYTGHKGPVRSLAISPDGRWLASGGADHTVRLWSIEKGEELKAFRKHVDAIVTVTFGGSPARTISASRDAVVLTWSLEKAPGGSGSSSGSTGPPSRRAETLQAEKLIPLEGSIRSMLLSPNGKWLYALDATHHTLVRINTATLKADEQLELIEGTEAMTLSRDGKTLYAAARAGKKEVKSKSDGHVQVIDVPSLKLRKTVAVPADPYDIAVLDNGIVLLSGGRGEWTDIAVVDVEKETIAARWGGIWRQSLLQTAPDSKRVYVSTQGVSPGTMSALVVPEKLDDKPATYASGAANTYRLGGEFTVTPDGKYLLCKTGSVLRISDDRQEDMQGVVTLEPFLAAAASAKDGSLFLLSDEGTLRQYSYPDFKLVTTYRLGVVGYQAAFDNASGRLFVAAVDPKALGGRDTEKSSGGIYVYPMRELTK